MSELSEMEKSQKETPPGNSKEKKSFLDEDIGKDFLSSWKSMAATDDDEMDFGFKMASGGKNKKFNFDKLEMDFGLDSDFGKLDSFKVDMSDFDLPVTSKKAAKPKESSADESSDGKFQGKKGPFNFSFDFNELDNFNFESPLGKEEKVSSTSKDDQKRKSSVASEQKSSNNKLRDDSGAFDDRLDTLNFESSLGKEEKVSSTSKDDQKRKSSVASEQKSSNNKLSDDSGAFDDRLDTFDFESSLGKEEKVSSTSKDDEKKKSSVATEQKSSNYKLSDNSGAFDDPTATELLSASKPLATSCMETSITDQKHLNAKQHDCRISSDDLDSSSKLRSSEGKEIPCGAVIIDQETHLTEKARCSPDRSRFTFESNRSSTINEKAFSSCPNDDENGNITEPSSSHKIVASKNSSQLSIIGLRNFADEKNKPDGDSSTDSMEDHESDLRNIDLRDNPKSSICSEAPHETEGYSENQNLATELPTYPSSEPFVAISTSIDAEDTRALNVKLCKGEESALETKYTTSERDDTVPMSLETKIMGLNSDEGQPETKSDSINPEPASRELTKGEDKNVRHSSNIRMGLNTDKGQPETISDSINPEPSARELTKGEDKSLRPSSNIRYFPNKEGLNSSSLPSISKLENRKLAVSTSENTAKVHNTIGFQGSSSILQRKDRFDSPSSLNAKLMAPSLESVRKSKINPIDGSKLCLIKSPKKISNLSVFNISKMKSSVKVPDSVPKKDINSQQNLKHGMEPQNNAASEIAYLQNGINISMTKRSVKVPDSAPKDISALRNPKHIMEAQDNAASEITYLQTGTENKLPHNFSLKRKAFELPNSDLASQKPLKRVSPTIKSRGLNEPSQQVVEEKLLSAEKNIKPLNFRLKAPVGRDVKEPSPRVDGGESMRTTHEEKVWRHEEQKEGKSKRSLSYSAPFAASKMMDLELSTTFETHGNMEKAEAYTKELDDICNMLKKKHEEAKEVLIRALVNNNNLLMLDHPVHDHNICKVQKFAARLMSKELQT